jgi:hypothetical protein
LVSSHAQAGRVVSMRFNIRMKNKIMKYEYVVLAFDVVVALMGGFMTFLYDGGEVLLEGY